MKKIIFPARLFLVAALACNKDKLLKDVNVYLGTDLLLSPMAIQVYDANPANESVPQNAIIEVSGPDGDKIYSLLGEKELQLEGSMLNLGIRRKQAPTADAPLWFIVTVKAPGYLDASKLFSISDTSIFKTEMLPMIKLSAPPEGISILEKDFTVDAFGAVEEVVAATETGNGVSQIAQITIPKGTGFFGKDAPSPATGSGKIQILQFSPSAVNDFIPDGTILESNGKQKPPGSTRAASAFIVNVNVGGTKVETFSTPIEALLELDATLDNPQTQKLLAAGDSIPVWSYDESTAFWHEEKKTKVELAAGGKLTARVLMPHLTPWGVNFFSPMEQIQGIPAIGGGIFQPPAPTPRIWSFSSSISAGCPGYYFTRLETDWGQRLYQGEVAYADGSQMNLRSLLKAVPSTLRLRIFDGSGDDPGAELFNRVLNTTSQNVSLGAALPVNLTGNLEVSGTCDAGDKIVPTVAVYFREARAETDDRGWKTLGKISRGFGCSQRLVKGAKYDFRVPEFPFPIYAITIPATDKDIPVEVDENLDGIPERTEIFSVRYSGAGGNVCEIEYTGIKLPNVVCDELKRLLGQ